MSKKTIIILVSLLSIATIIGLMGVSASNKEIKVRSKITAQVEVVEGYYDKMWKVISQKAQVADQYKGAFKEIYPALIEGRYGAEKGGTLMKWIVESNPNFDVSLYKDLMTSIEAERTGFFMEQKLLIDLNNEHRVIRKTFPASLFVGSRPDIKITIISSEKTKKVMQSGKEDDIDLFKQ